ncbi:MAG TPA: vWA domain-containing protein [Longimicrobium sp.]|nr:vWA domain-containing protein [Longimicrobium sp.]
MRTQKSIPILMAAALLLAACTDGPRSSPVASQPGPRALDRGANAAPESWGSLTSPPLVAHPRPAFAVAAQPGRVEPASVSVELRPGQTVVQRQTAYLPPAPPRGDVVFSLDLTGSMGGELNHMKVNAVSVMNAVSAVMPDVQFGVTSYEDYGASYTSCGYDNVYGYGRDEPFHLSQRLTGSTASVASALGALTLGSGGDSPESYSRALYETYAELTPAGAGRGGAIGWRPGARRVVVNFADDVPHDCDVGAGVGTPGLSTGPDPGRDGRPGTSDDLRILNVIDAMAAHHIVLINLFSSPGDSFGTGLWNAYAARNGGTSFVINEDGSIPGGIDLATTLAGLIGDAVRTAATVKIGVCPGSEAYASWLVRTTPAAYTDVSLPDTVPFDVEFGPPAGTADGAHAFELCAIGDGAVLARQAVTVTVRAVMTVGVDIKPGGTPNSIRLNPNGEALIPVAVLTTPAFDAARVNPATVTLGDGAGTDTRVAERNNGSLYASSEDADGDGDRDLVLHFSRPALMANGDLTASSTRLILRGKLRDGTAIQGSDAVRVIP